MLDAVGGMAQSDLVTVSLGDGRVTRLTETPGAARGGMFSPDGRFIAYSSNESGQWEVYVRPYPEFDSRTTVSAGGGRLPMWSRDGTELFYIQDDRRMMAVKVRTEPTFSAARPEILFERDDFYLDANGDQSYDVARDGRFLMIQEGAGAPRDVIVVTNFFEELKEQVGN